MLGAEEPAVHDYLTYILAPAKTAVKCKNAAIHEEFTRLSRYEE